VAGFTALPSRTISSLDIGNGRVDGTNRQRGFGYLSSDIRAWLRGVRVPPAEVDTGSRDIDLGRPLLTPEDAAQFLGLNASTMKSWRARGKGPLYYRLTTRTVRYAPEDLEAWADNNAER